MSKFLVNSAVLKWVFFSIFYAILAFCLYILDCAVTQPHPNYISVSWLTNSFQQARYLALLLGLGAAVAVGGDIILQGRDKTQRRDFKYFPTPRGLFRALKATRSRLILISGILFACVYLTQITIELWEISARPHGQIWPPHYLFVVALPLWGILWSCDALTRPEKRTLPAAMIFTIWSIWIAALQMSEGFLIE